MIKTVSCTVCEGTGIVSVDESGNVIDGSLLRVLGTAAPCSECDGTGQVEDEDAVYRFDELSDEAKDRAREWFRGLDDVEDYSCTIDDAVRMADLIGIDISTRSWKNTYGYVGSTPQIRWSGFYCQGDGASFEGSYSYRRGSLKAVMAEAPAQYKDSDGVIHQSKGNTELHRIARELQQAQASRFYGISTRISASGRYSHSGTMRFDHSLTHPRTGDTEDYYESDATEAVEAALRDFADWIYSQLENDYEWRMSDESVDESIRCNEYDFTVEGERA